MMPEGQVNIQIDRHLSVKGVNAGLSYAIQAKKGPLEYWKDIFFVQQKILCQIGSHGGKRRHRGGHGGANRQILIMTTER